MISLIFVPRHHDDKNTERGVKSLSAGGVDRGDVYPVQLRLSILQETNSLAVKICKKVSSNLQPFFICVIKCLDGATFSCCYRSGVVDFPTIR